ncbi:MAG: glycosyltransferase [Nitrospirae bacterium]|nr:glycosyltransferase [Nitrospirota bacterium]
MKEGRVSILIRTKNEGRCIGQTLEAIFSQTYKDVEVLIIDSGSADNTLETARRYPVKIHEIKPEDFTWGYSLNYGFRRAEGEFVICLSAHALPLSVNWIETLIADFDDDRVAAVMCKAVPWPDCNPFDRRGLLRKFNIEKQEIKEGPPFLFGNTSCAVRKAAWEKVNYDESLSYCEDQDWLGKVRKLNYTAVYEPAAEVYHSHNETLKQIYKRHYQEAGALKKLGLRDHTFLDILIDSVAGSIYDMLYVLIKMDGPKWFFFAPLRRFTINYARFKSYRNRQVRAAT